MTAKISRRTLLCGLLFRGLGCKLGLGLAGGLTTMLPTIATGSSARAGSAPIRAQSLGLVAERAGILFGASASKEIFENPAYAALYRDHARILTTDVALKFDYLRPDEHSWDFAEADQLLAFARQNNMALRGHTLIWNENAPKWLRRKSGREIATVMDRHIDKVAGRYAGQLHSWDVVNEPFWPGHGKAGGYRTGPWFEAMGAAYVKRAFVRAAKADPSAKLVLNEAHCERNDEVGKKIRAGLLRLIDELQHDGVPLHAIGLQGHLQPTKAFSDQIFGEFLEKLQERGLDIYISEFDIDDSAYPFDPRKRDRLVARRTQEFLGTVLKVPAVKALICWQLSDRYSWYAHLARQQNQRAPRPLPFNHDLRPKAAYLAILRALKARRL